MIFNLGCRKQQVVPLVFFLCSPADSNIGRQIALGASKASLESGLQFRRGTKEAASKKKWWEVGLGQSLGDETF